MTDQPPSDIRQHDIAPHDNRCTHCGLYDVEIAKLPPGMPCLGLGPETAAAISRAREYEQSMKSFASIIERLHYQNGQLCDRLEVLCAENTRLNHYIAKLTRPWWVRWFG